MLQISRFDLVKKHFGVRYRCTLSLKANFQKNKYDTCENTCNRGFLGLLNQVLAFVTFNKALYTQLPLYPLFQIILSVFPLSSDANSHSQIEIPSFTKMYFFLSRQRKGRLVDKEF